jgi:hypothetical protein
MSRMVGTRYTQKVGMVKKRRSMSQTVNLKITPLLHHRFYKEKQEIRNGKLKALFLSSCSSCTEYAAEDEQGPPVSGMVLNTVFTSQNSSQVAHLEEDGSPYNAISYSFYSYRETWS